MEKILEILKAIDPTIDYENIDNLIDGKVLDSLQIVTLVTEISNKFDITISPKYLEPKYFNSVDAIWEMVQDIQDEL
ncbi:MAG: acyl carrier protein [Parasporobacterium sp.]|nr:acyl carrier protein [Parasporobacterium sp.]